MPFRNTLDEMAIRPHGARSWALLEDLVYAGDSDTFTIPAGYVTDFATIPAFLRSPTGLEPFSQEYARAAIVHDWLITDGIPARLVTSRDTDGIFRRIMREEGAVAWTRWTMWTAVRWASLRNPRRAYGRQIGKDLPLMLLWSVPALLVAPAALLNLATRAVLKPLRMLR